MKDKLKALFIWLAFGVLRVLGLLPITVLLKLGRVFGILLFRIAPKTVHISQVNLDLCFPELGERGRRVLLKASLIELGRSIAETLFVWFKNAGLYLEGRIDLEGKEHWESALAQGKGVILLSCHSGSLDLNVALINKLPRGGRVFAFTYRQPSNTTADKILRTLRKPIADCFFPVGNLLGISRVLKKGGLVWYAPDIETSKKGRVFVKFMGVEAATPAAITKLAASTHAQVLPFMHKRQENGRYCIKFFPELCLDANASLESETQKVNNCIENIVREQPEAYWWCIKRFRYRSDGSPSVYSR